MKKVILPLVIAATVISLIYLYQRRNLPNNIAPSTVNSTVQTEESSVSKDRVSTVAQNLEIPWAIEFLPNNDILFTERKGALKLISNGQISTVEDISDVLAYGEGGLMGLVLHPNFSNNHYLYVQYTYRGNGDNSLNRVVRYKYENGELSDRSVIVDSIPGAMYHDGGRIKFGPDGFLYITTGDSGNPSLAQDTNSMAGKILRVTDEGKAPADNPFNNLVYSYGHRNPQGITWDDEGRLWETEHGRSAPSGYDEVNIIQKGKNYGWPEIQGPEKRSGMETPLAQSGNETWAPAGAVSYNGSLFFGGLKGQALFELKIENGNGVITKHFLQEFGRIREVILGPDNLLYITTSNRDGRGSPSQSDDRILKIDPSQL